MCGNNAIGKSHTNHHVSKGTINKRLAQYSYMSKFVQQQK